MKRALFLCVVFLAGAVIILPDSDFLLRGCRIIDRGDARTSFVVHPALREGIDELRSSTTSTKFEDLGAAKRLLDEGGNDETEVFPLALAICLTVASVGFSLFAAMTSFFKVKVKRPPQNGDAGSVRSEGSWVGRSSDKDPQYDSRNASTTQSMVHTKADNTEDDPIENLNPVLVAWVGLTCIHPRKKRNDDSGVVALSNVCGEMRNGELVAIMGSSGSGKTTLLDILSGHKSRGEIEGEISILGQHVKDVKMGGQVLKDVAAYVPQEVEFFPTQTPEEAVGFVANLKLGPDPRGDGDRQARIDSLLGQVGLAKEVRTRPIGGRLAGGFVIRGLSGGERKRLALACALAMKPSLLFLDEITSGLDSENALNVIQLLKEMCLSLNVAAAVVIHQPDIDIFKCFDRIILLSGGHCIFSGMSSNILEFYGEILKSPMPEHHRLPMDLIKQASTFNITQDKSETSRSLEHTSELLARRTGSSPSVFYAFRIVLQRNLVNHYVRNFTNVAARLLVYAACAAILGLVFWQVGTNEDGETDATSFLIGAFLFLTQICYLLPFCQISTFFFDKHVFTTESALGLYPPWMYSVSQSILEAWVLVLAALLQACIAVPMIGLWNPAMSKFASFLTTLSVFCVNGMVGNAIILFLSMVTFSQDLAFLVGSAIVVVSLATSGGFVPFPAIPEFIVWLQWLFPIKYSLQAFSIGAFTGTDAMETVEMRELDRPDSVSANLGVLLGFFVMLGSGTIVSLTLQRELK